MSVKIVKLFGDVSALITFRVFSSFSKLYKSLYKLYFGIICFSTVSLSQYILKTVIKTSSSLMYNIFIGVYVEESKAIFTKFWVSDELVLEFFVSE